MALSMSVLSTQDYIVPVVTLGPNAPDPLADVLQFAFKPLGTDPGPSDWFGSPTASWVPETLNGQYLAQCLIGPANGGVALAIGSYVVWLKVVDNPEIPVFQAGVLNITP